MLLRPLHHIKNNAVAYLALVIALSGTSYAAINLPAGSVGTRQLKDRAITAAKLDPAGIAASIRAWATLQWTGVWHVQSSSSDIHVTNIALGEVVSWRRTRFPHNCMASVTPTENFAAGENPYGYLTTAFAPAAGHLEIDATAPNGTPQRLSVSLLIVCPTPGSQKVNR
jgi:hypothetical protein